MDYIEIPEELAHLPVAVEQEIIRAIRATRYGSVEIIIHDSVVVQVQRTEKVRFEPKTVKQARP